MSETDEIVAEFLVESTELVAALDDDLLALERSPDDPALLARVFRHVHTIKGTCGFLGFTGLERLTHAGESLLSLLRDRRLDWSPVIGDALLALTDTVRSALGEIRETGVEGSAPHEDLIAALDHLQHPGEGALPEPLGEILVQRGAVTTDEVTLATHEQQLGDARHLGEILVEQGRIAPDDVVRALEHQQGQRPDPTVRLDVGVLDGLVTLVSELVLARNGVLRATAHDPLLVRAVGRLDTVTTELQEAVLRTRMQPIGALWSRLPRVVRDLAAACGKQVRLHTTGEGTELDRTLLEAMRDPLTHLVRNAVDHGIEAPGVRQAAGKPAEGRLVLRAWHEGGQVHLEIADDGAGIDVEAIRARALERGLAGAAQLEGASDRELLQLIFLPGFSTAHRVTTVSGRGVGMDVVKTHVERIGGSLDLDSRRGLGTTLRIRIPLTLAIIPGLVVGAGGQRFVVPQAGLSELVRVSDRGGAMIERVAGAPVLRLRGRLLPLVFLAEALGLAPGGGEVPGGGGAPGTVAVLQVGDRRLGLVVDEVRDVEEIVVKPLGAGLGESAAFAGATIMGDGQVALILDVGALAQRAGVEADSGRPDAAAPPAGADAAALLLLDGRSGGQRGLPLAAVARLEELPAAALEAAGDRLVARYRDGILPLVRLADLLAAPRTAAPGADPAQVPVVVLAGGDGGGAVGLVVEAIRDVVPGPATLEQATRRPGVLGSAVIAGRVTDVLDVRALRAAAYRTAPAPALPAVTGG